MRSLLLLVLLTLTGCSAPEPWSAAPPPDVEVPAGMAYIPGGESTIGSDRGFPQERPAFQADVAPFFMDVAPVTVAAFRSFVEATAYTTEAEAFGNAGVFDMEKRQWVLVDGAYWAYPQGPDAPAAPDDHPVTQVSWNDARAFAEWAGKRLPTEVEREHAARNARNDQTLYTWGNTLQAKGSYQANTWQGGFPHLNTGEDGYILTSPVGSFGASELGLMDLSGNVWEWCADWYRPYADRDKPYHPGPNSARVIRGGSFLCDGAFCHGYRVTARMGTTPETALFHTGFRLVQDLPTG